MRIALDLGHGVGRDRGAVGLISEEEIINSVGNRVSSLLKSLGHKVIEVRPCIGIVSLLQSLHHRTISSNSFRADMYIGIHAEVGMEEGSEIYTFRGKLLPEAINILENLSSLGFRNRGIKDGAHLYVIKYTEAKAMIIKICSIMSNQDIQNYLKVTADRIAEAIVKGIDSNIELAFDNTIDCCNCNKI